MCGTPRVLPAAESGSPPRSIPPLLFVPFPRCFLRNSNLLAARKFLPALSRSSIRSPAAVPRYFRIPSTAPPRSERTLSFLQATPHLSPLSAAHKPAADLPTESARTPRPPPGDGSPAVTVSLLLLPAHIPPLATPARQQYSGSPALPLHLSPALFCIPFPSTNPCGKILPLLSPPHTFASTPHPPPQTAASEHRAVPAVLPSPVPESPNPLLLQAPVKSPGCNDAY